MQAMRVGGKLSQALQYTDVALLHVLLLQPGAVLLCLLQPLPGVCSTKQALQQFFIKRRPLAQPKVSVRW